MIKYVFIMLIGTLLEASATTFDAKTHVFPNGLQLVVIENRLSPVVTVNICYKVGTADDPTNLVGISHFLEHMMFKGTPSHPDFKKEVISKGGNSNAMTTGDSTTYLTDIASQHLEFILMLEADRMTHLGFTQQQVESEKKVVQEERRMRLENNPMGLTQEAYLRAVFWHHPYGVPPIGYPFHIEGYNYENVKEHYKTWYHPNNAIVIVAGDASFDNVKHWVEKYFGNIPRKAVPARQRIEEPDHKGVSINIESYNQRLRTTSLYHHFMAPNFRQGFKEMSKDHFRPLVLLAHILGGNTTSLLYKKFVEELKIALEVDCDYNWHFYDPFGFDIAMTLVPNVEPGVAKNLMKETIQELLTKGIKQEDLDRAKRDILANFAFAKDGNSQAAAYFRLMGVGFSFENIENWDKDFKSVTLDAVNKTLKILFNREPVNIMVLYSEPKHG